MLQSISSTLLVLNLSIFSTAYFSANEFVIKKGNITDYESTFNNKKNEKKETDYRSYLSFINRK